MDGYSLEMVWNFVSDHCSVSWNNSRPFNVVEMQSDINSIMHTSPRTNAKADKLLQKSLVQSLTSSSENIPADRSATGTMSA